MSSTTPIAAAGALPAAPARDTRATVPNIGRLALPLTLLGVVCAYFAIRSDNFATSTNVLNILRASAILLVIALGATLVVVAGSIDLSVGATAALAGTIVASLAENGHTGLLWLVVPIGLACGMLNGVLLAYVRLPSFLATLGTLFVFNGLALKITDGRVRSFRSDTLHSLTNDSSLGSIPNVVFWAIGAALVVSLLAYRTMFGRHVYAIGGNERVAELAGLHVRRIKVATFLISGLCAGVAGLLLVARGGGSSPGMGDPFLLNAIAAIVMGGTALSGGGGGPLRTVVGVLTITVAANGMTLTQVDPHYQTMVFGLIVLFASVTTIRRSDFRAVVK